MPPDSPIDSDDRIPTIIDEEKLKGDSLNFSKYPLQEDIAAIKERICRMKKFSAEIDAIGIDFHELARLIALNLYHQEIWQNSHLSKVRTKDRAKKVVKRWDERINAPEPSEGRKGRPLKQYEGSEHLKALADAEARKHFAGEEAKSVGCLTKRRPYLDRFIFDLKELFKGKTDRPYRYMAAIFNAFNLHPENFCGGCDIFYPDLCVRKNIFTCPFHKKSRDKLRKMSDRIGIEIPSRRYPR